MPFQAAPQDYEEKLVCTVQMSLVYSVSSVFTVDGRRMGFLCAIFQAQFSFSVKYYAILAVAFWELCMPSFAFAFIE